MYSDVGSLKSAPELAKKRAQAIYDFAKTGVPMTIITTFPGSVVGAQTAGPVKGKGLGGIDKPAPGMGLAAAKALLKQDLVSLYAHGNSPRDPMTLAKQEATAIFSYFSQAIVMTNDETSGPLPAPPPAGPVTGSIKGKGGVLSDSPGNGYDSAKSKLESELTRIYEQIQEVRSADQFAAEISEALHSFFIQGKVETTGTFVAPAVVAPPPAPPNGAYLPGVGASSSSTLT